MSSVVDDMMDDTPENDDMPENDSCNDKDSTAADVISQQVESDLDRYRRQGQHQKVAETLNSLGLIRLHMQRHAEQARACHEEALSIYRGLNHTLGMAITLSDLGFVYEKLHMRDQALGVYFQAVSLMQQQSECQDKKRNSILLSAQRSLDRVIRTPS